MAEMNENLPMEADDEKHEFKIKQSSDSPDSPDSTESSESNDSSANNKAARSLGNGRWKYHGKTYKEELLGKR